MGIGKELSSVGINISLPTATGIINFFLVLIGIIILGVIIGLLVWYVIDRKNYFMKIKIIKKVNNLPQVVRTYKARSVKIGNSGDRIAYIRKIKKYMPLPTIESSKDTFFYSITEDDEWINIGFEDIDEKRRVLKIKFLHQEMRFMRVAMQRNLKQRFSNKSFLEKYGTTISAILFVIIILIVVLLVAKEFASISKALADVTTQVSRLLESVSNMQNGGSGIRPAP